MKPKKRCPWVRLENPLYVEYHDCEWGRPVHEDKKLFEFLILEGAQAGLSWETVLKKRAAYQEAYEGFDPKRVAKFTEKKIEALLLNPGLIRNRLKIRSSVGNAKAFLLVQKEFGSFDKYLWAYVNNKQIRNKPKALGDYPTRSEISDAISKDLQKRGFKFVGTTIIYAYMQAVGLVNDHAADCSFAADPKKIGSN